MKRRDLLTRAALGAASGALGSSASRTAAAAPAAKRAVQPPVREVIHHADKARSGVTLGGLGCGGGELRKDGRFSAWTIFNNEPRSNTPFPSNVLPENVMFFKVRFEEPGKEPRIKALQVEEGYDVAAMPLHIYEFPWMSGVDEITYQARFPFAELTFRDPEMPLEIRMVANSFFVPHDVDASTLPAILFDFEVKNRTGKPVEVMLMAAQRNCVGYNVKEKLYTAKVETGSGWKMIESSATNLPGTHATMGTMALASLSDDSTHYAGWEHRHPYYEKLLRSRTLPNVDDTPRRTTRDRKTGKRWALDRTYNTAARSVTLAPHASFQHQFVMTWNFPNQYNEDRTRVEGNYYSNRFKTAGEVARHVIKNRADLLKRTRGFVDDLYETTVDQYVLDQINSQLNTFVTSSFMNKAGYFGILEGIMPTRNMGPLATTDVSVYGAWPIATFFPELQKNTMRAHRGVQAKNGEVAHSLKRDFAEQLKGVAGVTRRLDLHPQYVSMVLRDYLWTEDRKYLEEMWPSIKQALDYCLRERDLNGDSMPDMEGIMSSYDNFPMFGTAAYIGSQWLAALVGARAAAQVLGDADAEKRYGDLVDKNRKIFEDRLWNGKYYRLWNDEGGKHGGKDEGCLTDQIIGQWVARGAGLGDLFDPGRVRTALKSILAMSYRPGFGLRNCSWPGGEPWQDVPEDIWVDQANTCWSGVELAFASLLLYEGLFDDAMKVIKTVDDRYRRAGRYWDHQEFGGHYYRPMAAWMILNGLLGFSLNQGIYAFSPKLPPRLASHGCKVFFATPGGTAHYVQTGAGAGQRVAIAVSTGALAMKGLDVTLEAAADAKRLRATLDGKPLAAAPTVNVDGKRARLRFAEPLRLAAGARLEIRPRG